MLTTLIYLSIFLARLPPLSLGFGLTSNILFRVICLLVFVRLILKGKTIPFDKLTGAMLIFFFTQAASVINAVNLDNFLYFFEKIAFSYVFYIIIRWLIGSKNRSTVLYLLIGAVGVNIFFESVLLFNSFLTNFIFGIIHPALVHMVALNLDRSRSFFETSGEIFTPILLYWFFIKKDKTVTKILSLAFYVLVFLLAFLSNFRDRFATLFVATAGFFFIYRKPIREKYLKQLSLFLPIIVTVFVAGMAYGNYSHGFTLVDRFLLRDRDEDISTLEFRRTLFSEALSMVKAHPVVGVGLGNFYEHMPQNLKNQLFNYSGEAKVFYEGALLYPHNFLAQTMAETGLLGLGALLYMLYQFIKVDWTVIRSSPAVDQALVVSFWALIFYSLLSPKSALLFYCTIFLLRRLIQTEQKNTIP